MSASITIIRAMLTDAHPLTALSIQTFRDTFAADNNPADMEKYISDEMNVAKIKAELNDPDNVFFLACYDGILAGYSKVRGTKKPETLQHYSPLELERIYVLKEYHGAKMGAALLQHCIDYAISKQHDVIWLGVWEHNRKAINFYKRWGFEFFGSHIFRLGNDNQTDLLMKKTL